MTKAIRSLGALGISLALTLPALAETAPTETPDIVIDGGAVTLPGIGKVACRARPARMVRNPQTQEMMPKPADNVVKVTIAKSLKDVVNA